jgi:hypothetical protein
MISLQNNETEDNESDGHVAATTTVLVKVMTVTMYR